VGHHHPLEQVVRLGQGLGGQVGDERLQRLPLGLPFVSVQSRLGRAAELLSETGSNKPG
jgi:hypothetical protein